MAMMALVTNHGFVLVAVAIAKTRVVLTQAVDWVAWSPHRRVRRYIPENDLSACCICFMVGRSSGRRKFQASKRVDLVEERTWKSQPPAIPATA